MSESISSVGTVVETNGRMATVVFKRSKACGDCHACASFSNDEAKTEVENTLGAKQGDRVVLELHSGSIMKASLIMYGIPLASLVLGVLIGSRFSDLWAALGGLLLAALSLVLIRLFEPKLSRKNEFSPKMTSILTNDE